MLSSGNRDRSHGRGGHADWELVPAGFPGKQDSSLSVEVTSLSKRHSLGEEWRLKTMNQQGSLHVNLKSILNHYNSIVWMLWNRDFLIQGFSMIRIPYFLCSIETYFNMCLIIAFLQFCNLLFFWITIISCAFSAGCHLIFIMTVFCECTVFQVDVP